MLEPMIDMLNVLNAQRPADFIVGRRAGSVVCQDEFLKRVSAWRTLLERTAGSKFALYITDGIEFASALYGAWHAGKIVYLPGDALPATCADLRGEVEGYLGEFEAAWSPIAPAADSDVPAPMHFAPLQPDFPGLVVHTSGTTGAAQAIPKKLSQLATEVATLETLLGAKAGQADILATVSHQHLYGLLFKVLWPLAAGRTIHAHSFAYPEELAAALALRDCMLVSSPAHLKRLPEAAAWNAASQRLRAIFSSGGPLPIEVACSTKALLGQAPIEVYGSSETGGLALRQQCGDTTTAWKPMPGVEWRIDGETGVLEVSSAHLPDANWFRLADRATSADDGGFLLQGRVDRIVKIEEKRISLDAIERALTASPLVTDARLLVRDGERQRIAAFVVLSTEGSHVLGKAGKLALNRSLRDMLTDSVERVALPRIWRYVNALPVNAQGKTTHAELTALLERETVAPTMPHQRLLEKDALRAVFELIAPHDLLYFDGHFPNSPILPGVAQVDWAIAYGRQCFDLPSEFCGIQALKFQNVIRPEIPFMLELVHEPEKSRLVFRFSSEAGQHASGRILFRDADV